MKKPVAGCLIMLCTIGAWGWFGPIGRSYREALHPQRIFHNHKTIGAWQYFAAWNSYEELYSLDGAVVFCDIKNNFVLVFRGAEASFRAGYSAILDERSYKIQTDDRMRSDAQGVNRDTLRIIEIDGSISERRLRTGAASQIETVLQRHESLDLDLFSEAR